MFLGFIVVIFNFLNVCVSVCVGTGRGSGMRSDFSPHVVPMTIICHETVSS